MPEITFAAPILPGKEEEWRRFVQEVTEELSDDYEDCRRRLGISNESVWLVRTNGGETVMAYLETGDPARVLPALRASKKPFDVWLKGRLSELHGGALARMPRKTRAELIFTRKHDSGGRHREPPSDTGGSRGAGAVNHGLPESGANVPAAEKLDGPRGPAPSS